MQITLVSFAFIVSVSLANCSKTDSNKKDVLTSDAKLNNNDLDFEREQIRAVKFVNYTSSQFCASVVHELDIETSKLTYEHCSVHLDKEEVKTEDNITLDKTQIESIFSFIDDIKKEPKEDQTCNGKRLTVVLEKTDSSSSTLIPNYCENDSMVHKLFKLIDDLASNNSK